MIGKYDGSTKSVSLGLTLEGAQVIAEDYVRQSGAAGLTWRQASWRQRPVTDYEKMVKKMRWLHIPVLDGMTAGQASDLIGQAELKKRLNSIGGVHHG